MKKALFVLGLLVTVCSASFAGGPVTAPQLEQAPVEKPKLINVELADDLYNVSTHWTVGLGLGGNPLIGKVDKDGFGYPRSEAGICTGIGFAITNYSGYPTREQISAAIQSIRSKHGNFIDERKIPSMVREELGINSLDYIGYGIFNLEMGRMWILSDNWRTRLGIGLPTIVSFGINYDF